MLFHVIDTELLPAKKKESVKIWSPCSILHPLKDQADHLTSEEPAGDNNQDLGCWESDRTWRGQLQQVRQTDELRPHLGLACPQLALRDVPWIEIKVTHNGNYHLAQRSGKLLCCQAETSHAHFCLALKEGLGVLKSRGLWSPWLWCIQSPTSLPFRLPLVPDLAIRGQNN